MDESLSVTTNDAAVDYLARFHDVTLIARFRRPNATSSRAYPVFPVAAPRVPVINMLWFFLRSPFLIRHLLRTQGFDVILTEPASVLPAAVGRALTPKARRTPLHLDVRTMPLETPGWRGPAERLLNAVMMRVARHSAAGFTAITPGVRAWMSDSFGIPTESIALWSTGVDPALFNPAAYDSARDVEGLGDQAHPVRLLYHGAMDVTRGLPELLRATAICRDSSRTPVRLTLLGTGRDAAAISRQVDELGLRDIVDILPPVPLALVPAVIAEHDLGVIPLPDLQCWRTSSPTKVMEYLAMEKPIVATDIEAHRAILGTDGPVKWATPGDPQSLANAIDAAARDLVKLTDIARASRETFVAAYSWDTQAAAFLSSVEEAARRS